MFVENFSKFMKYYGEGQKLRLFGFFIISFFAGLLELSGVVLVFPFILLITNPQNVINSKYYSIFVSYTHCHNVFINTFILGVSIILLFVLKNLYMIATLYIQNKFISIWKLAISKKFMRYYLYTSYKETLKTQPSEKMYNLNFLVTQTLEGFIFRIINFAINMFIVTMILGFLFFKFFYAALITSIFVFVSMVFQNKIFKKKLAEISQKFFKSSVDINEKILENINNLKEIKILSCEDYFYNEYIEKQKNYVDINALNNFYIVAPMYVIEIFIVLSLFIMAGIISIQNINETSWMVASYAVIAAAIFRIAPALNRIQNALNGINASRDFVKTINKEYEKFNLDFSEEKIRRKVEFKDSLRLENVSFSYRKELIIRNLNLEVKQGEFIGIIGLSGAGKSTLADIIMGLLPVNKGEIFVDDKKFDQSNYNALRKLIGYVPQQINVLNKTFKTNVALGVRENEIDEERVVESLKRAQLYFFVSSFEDGINTKINSESLSQGQKQRLAIARALYRDAQILIFDEATSSLDVETEFEITSMLNDLKGEKTIIAIAHRLSTLKNCDRLVYLKRGSIVDTGSFSELSNKYEDFEKLIKLSRLDIK